VPDEKIPLVAPVFSIEFSILGLNEAV